MQSKIQLYPNPASDHIIIELQEDSKVYGEATVQLITLNGQVLKTEKLQVVKGKIYSKIKLNNAWKDQLLLVKIVVNNKTYVGKLVRISQ
jgi:hypothetical protein